MSAIYDNWERLVAAVIKKQQLWDLFHEQSRSPSILSDASSSLSSLSRDLSFHEYSSPPQLVLLSDFSPPLDVEHIDWASTEFLGRGTFGSAYSPPRLRLLSDFSPPVDVQHVNGVSTELLGRGTSFGSTYVARINDVKRFVVKSVAISEVDFKRVLKVARDGRHENVVALRAYYSSPSSPHKLLLYDYYTNGSMYSLLFGENRRDIGWETRVRIAIGAARGIAQIHAQLLVHGNIKSSNILRDQLLFGCVSDLGFTNTTFNPEVKKTQINASQASDVYSFGILLLQLVTRNSSMGTDLIKLVGSVKERATKVLDPDLMKYPCIREQIVEMLQIGMRCVAKSSKERPKMSEVVKMLEHKWHHQATQYVVSNPLEGKIVFLEDARPRFELEDLLRTSAEILGRGSFGSSFEAILDSGNRVAVKRLIRFTATFQNFHQHMEVFGRMNHKNVGRLKAYYYTRDEKILVYDYFHQGSLSVVLKGTSLDWDTRLKIAVGAARGIAHIHTQYGGRLVLGNIKSSNILINGQHCSIGFDAGLANLMNPKRPSQGYCAPEASSGKVSQASDVYSFGVVLLELVSGRPADYMSGKGPLVKWVQFVDRTKWSARGLDVKRCGHENEVAMMSVFRIARSCVSFVPEHRPTIFDVVKGLEKISGVEAEIALDDRWKKSSIQWKKSSIQSGLESGLESLWRI